MKVEIIDDLIKLTSDGSEAENMAIIAIQKLISKSEFISDEIFNFGWREIDEYKVKNFIFLPIIISSLTQ